MTEERSSALAVADTLGHQSEVAQDPRPGPGRAFPPRCWRTREAVMDARLLLGARADQWLAPGRRLSVGGR
jgi:hypothetical protein